MRQYVSAENLCIPSLLHQVVLVATIFRKQELATLLLVFV